LLDEGLEPFEVPNLWLVSDEPDTFVDITDVMDTKLQALGAHASQGVTEAFDRVRERAEMTAREANLDYRYAEGFKAFRFVDDDEQEPA
jgi:LmbE family N-acetylglucosaminyl deacetylase